MASKAQITNKRVAELTDVSQTTASLVFSYVDSTNISADTRQRVLETANAVGYVPHVSACAPARGRSTNIGVVLVHSHEQVFINEYIPHVITGLSKVAREADIKHGWIAGKMLIGLINNKPLEQNHILLKTESKIRDSRGFRLWSANNGVKRPANCVKDKGL